MDYIGKQKLRWNSTRRSLLELDVCLDKFLQQGGLDQLSEEELLAYQELLRCDDSDLLILVMGKDTVDDKVAQGVIDKIRSVSRVL